MFGSLLSETFIQFQTLLTQQRQVKTHRCHLGNVLQLQGSVLKKKSIHMKTVKALKKMRIRCWAMSCVW